MSNTKVFLSSWTRETIVGCTKCLLKKMECWKNLLKHDSKFQPPPTIDVHQIWAMFDIKLAER